MNDKEMRNLYSRHIIDNRKVKMTNVINHLINQNDINSIDMAVGYFYTSGLNLIKNHFFDLMNNRYGKLRIIMGNQTNNETASVINEGYSNKIYDDVQQINDNQVLKNFAKLIRNGKVSVKIYTGKANYFHAKSYLFFNHDSPGHGNAIVGSSNFSLNGLNGNTELNVFTQDSFWALKQWFNGLWDSEEVTTFSCSLLNILEKRSKYIDNKKKKAYKYKSIEETYYQYAKIFSHPTINLDLSKQQWINNLYPHQRMGMKSIYEKLNMFNTAILADGVGLGKTRTASAVVKLELKNNSNLHVLLIANKKLWNQWDQELKSININPSNIDYISRDKFANYSKLELDEFVTKYDLVLIDEAHQGFRNNKSISYKKMEYVVGQSNNHIKGLLITATPWNNSREDVISLGSMFLNIHQIPSDRLYGKYFLLGKNKANKKLSKDDEAFNEFWTDLFLQRTRKTYGGKGVQFSKRIFPTVNIAYEPQKDHMFSDNFELISKLTFPYMDVLSFFGNHSDPLPSDMFRMILLKRADSSWIAYRNTLENTLNKLNNFKNELKNIHNSEDIREFLYNNYSISNNSSDNSELLPYQQNSRVSKNIYYYKVNRKIKSLNKNNLLNGIDKINKNINLDLSILEKLINKLKLYYSKIDEKRNSVVRKVFYELNKGNKVILISEFNDTVKYYFDEITQIQGVNKNKVGMVTGNTNSQIGNKHLDKEEVLGSFSPKSKLYKGLDKSEEINLLIGTDAISTGQNLQDSHVLMNIDLPYNPMILEQRIGRIDRPSNDSNRKISVYTFPVYKAIDAELKMSNRLGHKIKGVLNDTQFDNVILPEYKDYLKEAEKNRGNAVKKMLNSTIKNQIYDKSINSEKHSAQYSKSNDRMRKYLKYKDLIIHNKSIINKYSFTDGDSHSILVAQIHFNDVNKNKIKTNDLVIDLEDIHNNGISNGEVNLSKELSNEINNTNELNINKSKIALNEIKDKLFSVKKMYVQSYNKEIKQSHSIIDQSTNKISEEAAINIYNDVNDYRKRNFIFHSIKKAGIEDKNISDTIKNIITNIKYITSDNPLFEDVKDIKDDSGLLWNNFSDYLKKFSNSQLKIYENNGGNSGMDNRKADLNATNIVPLFGNIVIKNNE